MFRGKRNESRTNAKSCPGCDVGGAGSKTPNVDAATLCQGPVALEHFGKPSRVTFSYKRQTE